MINTDWWLPELRPVLEQGDIIETNLQFQLDVPIKYLVRGQTSKNQKRNWEESDSPKSSSKEEKPRILSNIDGQYGLVLSYGCEIDKTKLNQSILIAPVVSLSKLPPSLHQNILNQEVYRYLPIVGLPNLESSYANLSKTFALQKQLIDSSSRIRSMTDEGILRVRAQLVGYYTRLKLPS
jgi:hypothetical protein